MKALQGVRRRHFDELRTRLEHEKRQALKVLARSGLWTRKNRRVVRPKDWSCPLQEGWSSGDDPHLDKFLRTGRS